MKWTDGGGFPPSCFIPLRSPLLSSHGRRGTRRNCTERPRLRHCSRKGRRFFSIASGVQMEAESVEDQGESVQFNVYCYNVQPGVEIDYATGENWIEE